ncbi:MAG: ribonuclease HII [Actinomycetota bacterium]
MPTRPTLRVERGLLAAGHALVAGADEVGRGALAGPVTAGVVLLDAARKAPDGLRDSKLLSPARREGLVPEIEAWASASAVGHASAAEIDHYGILRALRLAGERALAQLSDLPEVVLLDGNHDWLHRPARIGTSPLAAAAPRVELRVRADLECASAAAASVLAKVARDAIMTDLARAFPAYGWDENRGYASDGHRRAIAQHGPCEHHRKTWQLLPSGVQGELWAGRGPDPGPPGAA